MAYYTYDEVVLALDLYMRTPPSRINVKNAEIIELSDFISKYYNAHSVNSVKMMLENFKSLNPEYTRDGRKGLPNASKIMKTVWDEYFEIDFAGLSEKARRIRETKMGGFSNPVSLPVTLQEVYIDELSGIPPGEIKEYLTKVRIHQDVFRSWVLASFDNKCCITGMGNETILRASHIKPWSVCTPHEKTDPGNGLCLNPLHDLAFDKGLISIDQDLQLILSPRIDDFIDQDTIKKEFEIYEDKPIHEPSKIRLKPEFIRYHNEHVLIV